MNAGWLALALAAVVVAIGAYTAYLGFRRRRLEERITELESDRDRSI